MPSWNQSFDLHGVDQEILRGKMFTLTAYDNDRYFGEGDGVDDVIGSTKPQSFADLAT